MWFIQKTVISLDFDDAIFLAEKECNHITIIRHILIKNKLVCFGEH